MAVTFYDTELVTDQYGNSYFLLVPRAECLEVLKLNPYNLSKNPSINNEKPEEAIFISVCPSLRPGSIQEHLIPVNYELKEVNQSSTVTEEQILFYDAEEIHLNSTVSEEQQNLSSTVHEKQMNVNCTAKEEQEILVSNYNEEQINLCRTVNKEQNSLYPNVNEEQNNLFPVYNEEPIFSDAINEEQQNLNPMDFEGQLDFSSSDNGNYLESLNRTEAMIDSECSCTCSTNSFNRNEKMNNVMLVLDKKLRNLPPCMKPQAYSDILLYLRYLKRQHQRMVLRGVEKTIPGC